MLEALTKGHSSDTASKTDAQLEATGEMVPGLRFQAVKSPAIFTQSMRVCRCDSCTILTFSRGTEEEAVRDAFKRVDLMRVG